MMYRVLPDAQRDLEDIDSWVSEHFGPLITDRTQAKLYDTFALLAQFPHVGNLRSDIDPRPVRFFHVRPYWIVYQPEIPLLIHRVYHAARDLNRLQLK